MTKFKYMIGPPPAGVFGSTTKFKIPYAVIDMVLYEVTLQVEPHLAVEVEEHMRQSHIPEIFATGCFRRIRFCLASANRFRTTYQADGQADLDRYLREHAPRLRAEFQTRFPAGVILTRETWVQRESWA